MSTQDRVRWDERYANRRATATDVPHLPALFQPFAEGFPTTGHALELACGTGSAAVWLARRGLDVCGFDVSPVAIAAANELALVSGVAARCQFEVADLDEGLPAGPRVEVLLCNKFRDAHLDEAIIDRLAPGGVLAISALSEVGADSGPFRTKPGELTRAFGRLNRIAGGEAHGTAWLLAHR